jgi:hypothetical protein
MHHRSPNNVGNFSIKTVTADKLAVYRGDGTTLLGTCSTILDVGRWYYIRYYVKIHDTAGEIKVFVDNVEETITWETGTWDTQDTRGDAGAGGDTCSRMLLHSNGSSSLTIDDWIINDTTGIDNVSYPDNLGIEALMPNAAGDSTGLSRGGTDSGANWSQVEERPENDGTDWVYDTVVNDYDLYNYPSTQWTTVAGVVVSLRAQKSDAGAASIAHVVKYDTDASGTADTEETGADIPLSNSWVHHEKYYNRQPDNTSWTPAKVNALQAGVKVR